MIGYPGSEDREQTWWQTEVTFRVVSRLMGIVGDRVDVGPAFLPGGVVRLRAFPLGQEFA
ncbi:MAG: hypothetical protein GY745_09500 [Actinomycetia bacterium]|nr:hypothetical protein [Actinomycetes bacterium]MCP4085267.1 hypothetical protein [Actinomycetes bacterium]